MGMLIGILFGTIDVEDDSAVPFFFFSPFLSFALASLFAFGGG